MLKLKKLSLKPLIRMKIRFHHCLGRDEIFEIRSHIVMFRELFVSNYQIVVANLPDYKNLVARFLYIILQQC
jgi:hypothetical protein